jgi:hypothetical protein
MSIELFVMPHPSQSKASVFFLRKRKPVFFKERENFLKSFGKNLEIKLAIYLKLLIVSRDLFWLQGGRKNNDKHLYRSWKNQSHHGNLFGFFLRKKKRSKEF